MTRTATMLMSVSIAGVVYVLTGTTLAYGEDHASISVTQLTEMYRSAKTELERRQVCLKAIDAGLIRSGGKVLVIERIFGKDFSQFLPDAQNLYRTGVVRFTQPPEIHNDAIAVAYVGWYMAVTYDSVGTIVKYYLSNWHK